MKTRWIEVLKMKKKIGNSFGLAAVFTAAVSLYVILLAFYPSWLQNLEGRLWRNQSETLMDHAEYITTGSSLRLSEIQQLKNLRNLIMKDTAGQKAAKPCGSESQAIS